MPCQFDVPCSTISPISIRWPRSHHGSRFSRCASVCGCGYRVENLYVNTENQSREEPNELLLPPDPSLLSVICATHQHLLPTHIQTYNSMHTSSRLPHLLYRVSSSYMMVWLDSEAANVLSPSAPQRVNMDEIFLLATLPSMSLAMPCSVRLTGECKARGFENPSSRQEPPRPPD